MSQIRDMTIIAETKVCKRVKARIAERGGSPQSPGPSTSSHPVKTVTSTTQRTLPQTVACQPRICPPMSTIWREVALPRFFADFVFESTVFTGSGLSFLPELYGRPDQHAPLIEALSAVASLSMANQLRIESLKLEALQSYFHAIQLMAKLLQHPDEAQQDATLATNYLFGLFEYAPHLPEHWFIGRMTCKPPSFNTKVKQTKTLPLISGFRLSGVAWSRHGHHFGRVSLLELRGEKQFTTPLGINIFRTCYGHLVVKCITEHVNPTEGVNTWLETIPLDDPGLKLSRCNLRTARLCHEAQTLFDNYSEDECWLLKMLRVIKEAILIDLQYQEWADSLPTPWRPRIFRKPGKIPAEATTIYLQHYVYADVYVAWASNTCRAARIHLHEVLFHCVSLIELHACSETSLCIEETRRTSRIIISEMISEICASIDFCLGDIDSFGAPASTEYRMPLHGYLIIWILWRTYVSAPKGSELAPSLGSSIGARETTNSSLETSNSVALALIYAYPLTLYIQTYYNTTASVGANAINRGKATSTASKPILVRPNADYVYSPVAIDLSHDNVELTLPNITDGRSYVVPFYDLYADNFANLGSVSNSPPGKYLLRLDHDCEPGLVMGHDEFPQYLGVVTFPTTWGSMMIRIVTFNNGTDLEAVLHIESQIDLNPVSRPGPPSGPALTPKTLLGSSVLKAAALKAPWGLNTSDTTALLDLMAAVEPYNKPENNSDDNAVRDMLSAGGIRNGIYTPPPSLKQPQP
ncbi:hypothetical protein B7463_g11367, partial [Scytalidium lignicola]